MECHSVTDDRDAQMRENYERKRRGRPGVWNTIRETVVLRARQSGSLYPNATIEARGRFDEDKTSRLATGVPSRMLCVEWLPAYDLSAH